ncbi:MAG TPA: DUF814 domain-containing protein, partial [Firmicutes bacterium]|nr:DUF814 domain-containing protein [Bacillota bacterium]
SGEKSSAIRVAFIETLRMILNGEPLTGESGSEFVIRVAEDFISRREKSRIDKARSSVGKVIEKRYRKLESLMDAMGKDMNQSEKAVDYKKRADLLLANIFRVKPGMKEMEVEDWENGGGAVRIPLDPQTAPQIQVENLYKRYRKLKRAGEIAHERRRAVESEIEELDIMLENLSKADSVEEIEKVREQAEFHGLIFRSVKDEHGRGKQEKKRGRGLESGERFQVHPHRYRSNDGFLILAGTGDRSNEALRHLSRPDDVWLHVRDIPGAHVYIITRGKEVPDSTIREAAMVAVWHSKAKYGSNVPVDYTRAKYIDPIPSAGPGHVRFRRERTIRVTPDEKRIEMMAMMAGDDGRKG